MAVKKIYLHEGQLLPNNKFGDMRVLYHNTSRDVGIEFVNTGFKVTGLQVGNVMRGGVKDMRVPSVQGVGYLNTSDNVTKTEAYVSWHSMLERCYSEAYLKTRPTYKDVFVCEEWLDFTAFRDWFDSSNHRKGYHLDKDILYSGNNLYCPEKCTYVPQRINSLVMYLSSYGDCKSGVSKRMKKGTKEFNGLYNLSCCGAYLGRFTCEDTAHDRYKEFKSLLMEEVADQYYELGLISSEIRDALYRFEIKPK